MADFQFCKQRLLEAAEFTRVGNFRASVEGVLRQLLETRLQDDKDRAALRRWAALELQKLEITPGSETSKLVPLHDLGETGRKMAMFQTVLDVLDESPGAKKA